jgi:hypothetical protein
MKKNPVSRKGTRSKLLPAIFFFLLLLFSFPTMYAQVSFTYASSGMSTTTCNAFYPTASVPASNSTSYNHLSLTNQQTFDGSTIGMLSNNNGGSLVGNAYAIDYGFQAGYTYRVTANLKNAVYSYYFPFGQFNPLSQTYGNTTKVQFGISNSLPYTSTASCSGFTPQSPFTSLYSSNVGDNPGTNVNVTTSQFLVGSATSYLLFGTWSGPITDGMTTHIMGTTNINSITITGVPPISPSSDYMCSSTETYSVSTGLSVSWSVSSGGIVTPTSGSGNSITLTKISDGTITLTATVTDPLGNPIVVTKNIIVGTPTWSSSLVPLAFGDNQVCQFQENYIPFTTSNNSGDWSYVSRTGSPTPSWNGSVSELYVYFFNGNQTSLTLRMDATNTCGTTSEQFRFVPVGCFRMAAPASFYAMSPNPTSGIVHITKKTVNGAPANGKTNKDGITKINVYDINQVLVFTRKYDTAPSATINLGHLRRGNYFVNIISTQGSETQQLILK